MSVEPIAVFDGFTIHNDCISNQSRHLLKLKTKSEVVSTRKKTIIAVQIFQMPKLRMKRVVFSAAPPNRESRLVEQHNVEFGQAQAKLESSPRFGFK
jgi:hypothetical protein